MNPRIIAENICKEFKNKHPVNFLKGNFFNNPWNPKIQSLVKIYETVRRFDW